MVLHMVKAQYADLLFVFRAVNVLQAHGALLFTTNTVHFLTSPS